MTRKRKLATFGIIGLAGAFAIGGTVLHDQRSARADRIVAAARPVAPAKKPDPRKIQVAILLDTSGSMDGLIDQAKSQLWRIVNELAAAQRQGVNAKVEIALYEYGKQTVSAEDGFVRRILPFTTDLDRVSEELFALRTNGGEEYCGRAISEATRGLEWSSNPDDMKLVFIAGNESFAQGEVSYRGAIAAAKEKGITVNVIHCGSGEEEGWREASTLALGEYMNIDHNRRVATVDAPQDDELRRLSGEINGTYLAYGAGGRASFERQAAQDKNAEDAKQGAVAARTLSKASGVYRNDGWDLVDGVESGAVDLAREANLPAEMKGMTIDQRKAHVAATAAKRKEIQARIVELSKDREKFVEAELKKRGEEGGDTLDKAVVGAVRAQATKHGFELKK